MRQISDVNVNVNFIFIFIQVYGPTPLAYLQEATHTRRDPSPCAYHQSLRPLLHVRTGGDVEATVCSRDQT